MTAGEVILARQVPVGRAALTSRENDLLVLDGE